ncbi:MAG: UDP-N-acetylglucosamine 2-epimerase (non-hydrolyzing) [Desulfomonile tiedjei]|uniref:UDP-N-acetylglucosamine 2-epimerase (Non-hydrolyzing) n=1 Tax=Desulfomonile tiedjei TaxID=2358 RepID=A0A9D6UYF8_9BACT|nr:UDP-N-acetylglucosamine 2-epimerase (non-hydrolyzing) [Desulfomonile tiedjei]
MQKKVVSVVGARPNFMKIAPLERELRKYEHIRHITVHTGQHYDKEMSEVFFDQLGLSKPERDLGVGSGGHGEMTGRIMIEFEKACLELQPDMVIVVGDVNSTIAASLVARKLFIPVSHVEAGLRSFDETMPEELNRRLTDCLSNLLFVSEPSGVENLRREGIDMSRVHLVGDIMLETLQIFLPAIGKARKWEDLDLQRGSYALVTLHRPSNVDSVEALEEVVDILEIIGLPIVFPIHPRTLKRAEEFGLNSRLEQIPNLMLTAPMPYIDFLSLMEGCQLVFSDSGSVQSEASFFNIPCLVGRENTERPIYMEEGTSMLVGRDKRKIADQLELMRRGESRQSSPVVQQLGTGVGSRIVETIVESLD